MAWYEKLYTKENIKLCGFASPEQIKIEAKLVAEVLKLNPYSKLIDPCCGFGRHTIVEIYSLP